MEMEDKESKEDRGKHKVDRATGCEESFELMSLRLDGRLPDEDAALLEAHLAGCAPCRAATESLRRVDRLLRAAPVVGPAPGFADRFQGRLHRRRSRRRMWFTWLTLVLMVSFLGVVSGGSIIVSFVSLLAAVWKPLSVGIDWHWLREILWSMQVMVSIAADTAWVLARMSLSLMKEPFFAAYAALTLLLTVLWASLLTSISPAYGVAQH